MNNNIHPTFQPIIDMLNPIDTSGLDQSRASLKKMIREMEPEKDKTMIFTTKKTETKEITIEITAPAYYKDKWSINRYMLCEDGAIIIVQDSLVSKWLQGDSSYHQGALAEMLAGTEIPEEEFTAAFESALETFTKSVYPIAQTA